MLAGINSWVNAFQKRKRTRIRLGNFVGENWTGPFQKQTLWVLWSHRDAFLILKGNPGLYVLNCWWSWDKLRKKKCCLGVTYSYFVEFQHQKTSSTNSEISLLTGTSNPSSTPFHVPQKLSPARHLRLNKSTRKQHATIAMPSDFLEKRQMLKISKAKRGCKRDTTSNQE